MKKITLITGLFLVGCGEGGGTEQPIEPLKIGLDSFFRVEQKNHAFSIPCPTDAVALFIAGQSNAANHSVNTNETPSTNVIQYHKGKCYVAASPLFGGSTDSSTATHFNPFHQVAVDYSNRIGKPVILAVFSIGGRSITKFAPGGEYHEQFKTEYQEFNKLFNVKYFLWQQGETDAANNVSSEEYVNSWYSMTRSIGISSPLIARSTKCASLSQYENGVGAAQDSLRKMFGGPNTDTITDSDRYDKCHFDTSGVSKFSVMWNEYLK